MNLPEIAFEEVRWSPVETLLWIATRSHRFVNALAGVPFMSLEEHRGGIQRGNHAPHPMTLPNALQLLCRELERGSLHPAAGEVPGAGDGTLSMFSIDEFLHMEIWFKAAEVVRTWADWPPTEAWKAAKARPWQPPREISKGWIRSLPPELYLPFGDVVDLLAFGPARLSIGLTDLEERTARLGAGLALVGAASEGHVKLTGMPCERNYPEAHLLRRLGPRMPIEPETLRDLVPVPFGGCDWLGPRRYAEDYAEMGHAPQSVSFCHVAVERISLLKWLSGVSMRVPGLSEVDVTSLIRAERAKNPRAGVGQMEQLIKANDPLFPREMVRQIARKLGVKGRRGRKRENSAE